ncbi:hypothetical protein [Paremcibacter congregatus]|uniref:hypothetical protein n=1 Tax=Paremcibacter congregatus TaxID=2043170 RepID=UPI0030EEE4FF|tara:strand:- start:13 stop:870 length:858 start_codon:yes stop_codon:yes gene_type:complete
MALDYAYSAKEAASNKPASEVTAFTLAGAEAGYQSFVAGGLGGKSSIFTAYIPGGAWQTFIGLVTDAAPDTITQTHLIDSSTGAWIDFSGEAAAPFIECVTPKGAAETGNLFWDNEWVMPAFSTSRTNGSWGSTGNIANLISVPRPCKLDGLAVYLTGGAAAGRYAKLALYEARGGTPDKLIVDAGQVEVAAIGWHTITGINKVIAEPGLYATSIISTSNSSQYRGNGASTAAAPDDMGTATGLGSEYIGSFSGPTSAGNPPTNFGSTGYRILNSYYVLARFLEL